MKVVILAGGLGTRLSEETTIKPKPMVEIGGMPILWHIMKIYAHYGYKEFIVCLGYKGYLIKEYFANYFLHRSDVTIDLAKNSIEVHDSYAESWKITLVDTGIETMTGGRIKRIEKYIDNSPFMLTYGDGVADININSLVQFHQKHGKYCTVTSVQPGGRFGAIIMNEDDSVYKFEEKPKGDGAWISGGFFVCQPEVFNYITEGDSSIWEKKPIQNLVNDQQLMSYKHSGFWRPMDTLRDRTSLEEAWTLNEAKWKIWE